MDNRIKELRKERGIRQEALAAKINVSQQTISRIETGENSLPADLLIQLSKFFHVSVDYILKISDIRMTTEYQIEYQKLSGRYMEMYRAYDKLNRKNQEILLEIAEQLGEKQKS